MNKKTAPIFFTTAIVLLIILTVGWVVSLIAASQAGGSVGGFLVLPIYILSPALIFFSILFFILGSIAKTREVAPRRPLQLSKHRPSNSHNNYEYLGNNIIFYYNGKSENNNYKVFLIVKETIILNV